VRLTYRILGPVEVVRGTTPLQLGGAKQRALLAVLLVHANEVVPRDRLIDDVWGDDPPATVDNALQVYVSRLRRLLDGPDGLRTIDRQGAGYIVHVDPADLDVTQFERLAGAGRAALERGDAEQAARELRSALALWRGPVLADLAGEPFALGRHAEAVAELQPLVAEHPYRERLRGQLMRALYASGRQTDALEAFDDGRRALDELGLVPGEPLKELQRQILRHDAHLDRSNRDRGMADRPPRRRRRLIPAAIVGAAAVVLAAAVAFATTRESGSAQPRSLTVVPKNSVAVIDPDSSNVVDAIPIGSRPSAIAVGAGDVWVGAFEDESVIRIDPQTRRVIRAIPLGAAPSRVAVADGAAWVTSEDSRLVARIRARTSFVTHRVRTRQQSFADPAFASIARVRAHKQAPRGVAVGFGSVWVAQGFSVVSRLQPRTARVLEQVDVAMRPSDVVAADERIWATTEGFGEVVAIDPRNTSVVTHVKLGGDLEYLGGIAAGYDAVWVGAYDYFRDVARVWRVDPASGRPTDSIRLVGPSRFNWPAALRLGHIRVAVGEGSVWVASVLKGAVFRIDPETLAVTDTISLPGALDVAVGEGSVWVAVTDWRSDRR
jgi:DNA-binding SARP family transcriptional activator/streptogramin lyase